MEGDALHAFQLLDLAVDVGAHGFGHRGEHFAQPARDLRLRAVGARQVDGDDLRIPVGQQLRGHLMGEDEGIEHMLDGLLAVAEQALCGGDQLRARQIAVTGAAGGVAERILDARSDAVLAVLFDAQRRGDTVGSLEAHALHVVDEPVGVLADDLLDVFAVLLEDLDSERGRDAVALQKNHGLALLGLFGVAFHDHGGALLSDAGHLEQALRLGVEHIERLLAEGLDEQLGGGGADAADHAAGEVLFDAGEGGRLFDLDGLHLDLAAIDGMLDPLAGDVQLLAGGDGRHDADGGHASLSALHDEHGIPVFIVAEDRFIRKAPDALHGAALLLGVCFIIHAYG